MMYSHTSPDVRHYYIIARWAITPGSPYGPYNTEYVSEPLDDLEEAKRRARLIAKRSKCRVTIDLISVMPQLWDSDSDVERD